MSFIQASCAMSVQPQSLANGRTPLFVTPRGNLVNQFGEVPLDSGTGTGTGVCFGNILPCADDTYNIGSLARRFNRIRLGTGASTVAGQFNPENVTATLGVTGARWVKIWAGTSGIDSSGPIVPNATNTIDIGATGTRWRQLWAGTSGINTTGHIVPNADNVNDLGTTTERMRKIWTTDFDSTGTMNTLGPYTGNLASNAYTATVTAGANVASVGTFTGGWIRIGGVVYVHGRITAVALTAAAPTASAFTLSLPVPRVSGNFNATTGASGLISREGSTAAQLAWPGDIIAVIGSETVDCRWVQNTGTAAADEVVRFTYNMNN